MGTSCEQIPKNRSTCDSSIHFLRRILLFSLRLELHRWPQAQRAEITPSIKHLRSQELAATKSGRLCGVVGSNAQRARPSVALLACPNLLCAPCPLRPAYAGGESVCQYALIVCQVRQKRESSDTIGRDSVTINNDSTAQQVAQIIPIEIPAIREFLHQTRRVERIPPLPELKNHQTPNESVVKSQTCRDRRCRGPCCADNTRGFSRQNFRQCEASEFGRDERQQSEITLLDLRPALRRQRRRFAPG